MKKNLISSFYVVLGLCLIGLTTVNPETERDGWTWNVSIVFILLFLKGYVDVLKSLYRSEREDLEKGFGLSRARGTTVKLLSLSVLMLFAEYMVVASKIQSLGGWTNDPDSVIYGMFWLNAYTNTMFFNIPMTLLGIFLTVLMARGNRRP